MRTRILTPEVVSYIDSQKWPKGLQYGLRESPEDEVPQAWITFYRDNWLTLPREDHEEIARIMFEVLTNLRNQGVPIFMERMESRHGETGP